jgi:D-psicose/D-tagatose/L-ribulose 3-epimerase
MKYSVCNELFGRMDLARTCAITARQGFHGLELAPFTVFEDPARVGPERIAEIRRALRDEGLEFSGFHWLLASPPGLHIASPDAGVRGRTVEHLKRLSAISGELGGGFLVLGSPKQRSAEGVPPRQAVAWLEESLARVGPFAAEHDSVVLLEALSGEATNVVNTIEEARAVIERIDSPGVGGMFDFHNVGSETLPWEELVRRNADLIRYVHLNELNGSYPGTGGSDFLPAFRALDELGYDGWVSLEIFHEPEDPEAVLSATMGFLREMERRTGRA